MNNSRVTSLTESALLAAITVILAMLAVYLPLVGMFAALIWPLPIIVLIVRHGIRWGILSALVASAIVALLVEPFLAVRLLVSFAPTGIMLGIAYLKGWSATKTLFFTIVTAIVANMVNMGLIFWITQVNPLTSQLDMLKESFNDSLGLYQGMSMDENTLNQVKDDMAKTLSLVSLLLPLVVFFMGLLDAVVNYYLSGKVLRRLGHKVDSLPVFTEWRLSKVFVYLLGFSFVGIYWGGTRHIDLLYTLSVNANMLAMFAGLVQGMALLECVLRHFKVSKFIKIVIFCMVILNVIFMQVLAFTGLFDMVFDYRRRYQQK